MLFISHVPKVINFPRKRRHVPKKVLSEISNSLCVLVFAAKIHPIKEHEQKAFTIILIILILCAFDVHILYIRF